jgi:uroporphyrinogen-III synthase
VSGRNVLVLRAEQEAARTAQALREKGHTPLLAPLFETVTLDHPLPENDYAAIAFASPQAPSRLNGRLRLRDIPVFTVGDKTADSAQHAGFVQIRARGPDRRRLAAALVAELPRGSRVLLPVGRDRHDDMVPTLEKAGLIIEECVIYENRAVETLPDLARQALARENRTVILHFSERSALVAIALCEKAGLIAHFCSAGHVLLSSAMQRPLLKAGCRRLRVAERPTLDAIIAAIAENPSLDGIPVNDSKR